MMPCARLMQAAPLVTWAVAADAAAHANFTTWRMNARHRPGEHHLRRAGQLEIAKQLGIARSTYVTTRNWLRARGLFTNTHQRQLRDGDLWRGQPDEYQVKWVPRGPVVRLADRAQPVPGHLFDTYRAAPTRAALKRFVAAVKACYPAGSFSTAPVRRARKISPPHQTAKISPQRFRDLVVDQIADQQPPLGAAAPVDHSHDAGHAAASRSGTDGAGDADQLGLGFGPQAVVEHPRRTLTAQACGRARDVLDQFARLREEFHPHVRRLTPTRADLEHAAAFALTRDRHERRALFVAYFAWAACRDPVRSYGVFRATLDRHEERVAHDALAREETRRHDLRRTVRRGAAARDDATLPLTHREARAVAARYGISMRGFDDASAVPQGPGRPEHFPDLVRWSR